MSLRRKAISSALWSAARLGVDQVFLLIMFVLITRKVTPAEVGSFVLVSSIIELFRLPISAIADAVIRSSDNETPNVAFWSSLVFSVVAMVLLNIVIFFAGPYLQLHNQGMIFLAMTTLLPLSALCTTHMSLLLRSFDHRVMTICTLAAGVCGGLLGYVMAVNGYGTWSLVAQKLLAEVIYVAFSWYFARWVPNFDMTWNGFRGFINYTWHTFLSSSTGVIGVRLQEFILGVFLGLQAVAAVRVAWRLVDVINAATIQPMFAVMLPLFGAVRDDKEKLDRAIYSTTVLGSLLTIPAALGFAVVGSDAVEIIFGKDWRTAGDIAAVLGLIVPINLLTSVYSRSFSAIGLPNLNALVGFAGLTVYCAVAIAASYLGLNYYAGLAFFGQVALLLFQLFILSRRTDMSARRSIKAMLPSVIASVVMYAVLVGLSHAGLIPATDPIVHVAVLSLLGALVFVAVMMSLFRLHTVSIIRILIPK